MADVQANDGQDEQYRQFLAAGQVRMPACSRCGHVRAPGSWLCPECLGTEWQWHALSGRAVIESFVWYMESVHQDFTEVPYNVALAHLEGGPRLVTNIVDCRFGEIAVGQPVEATVRNRGAKHLLCFRVAAS